MHIHSYTKIKTVSFSKTSNSQVLIVHLHAYETEHYEFGSRRQAASNLQCSSLPRRGYWLLFRGGIIQSVPCTAAIILIYYECLYEF
jgi:hypothetical protein